MTDHGARAHATWSASSSAANIACAGRLALIALLNRPDEESEAAAWGTACHQVSEKCLRGGFDADTLIGTTEKTKSRSFEVDEEMAETAQAYVDYVRKAAAGGKLLVEQRFSLEALNPPFDAGGTGDAVIIHEARKTIEIVDLKGGRGVVVEAKGNDQLRTYALGAMLANRGADVEHVTVTIVQPRAPHKDGRIRSETFHIGDLVEWTADLMEAMRLSKKAMDDLADMPPMTWSSRYLAAGSHCKFCPATSTCWAVEQKALDAVGVWFEEVEPTGAPVPIVKNDPDQMTPEQLSERLDLLDMIEDWIAAVRARAHTLAEFGIDIPNYGLVDKEGREKWSEGSEAAVRAACAAAGLAEAKFVNPGKLKTPKQIRKALGASAKDVAGLSETPKSGTNLVRLDKTSRAAATPAVLKHFNIED